MFLIAGYGYVGKAVENSILVAGMAPPIVIDPAIEGFPTWNQINLDEVHGVLICVATPEGADGSCDYSNVLEVLSHIPEDKPVLIKSTISIEAWREIEKQYPNHQLGFSPEFLTAKNAIDDYRNQTFVILSGKMGEFWYKFFAYTIPLLGHNPMPMGTIHFCSPEEAILTKYASNAFLAVKVGFFNHIYDLANLVGADYSKIRELLGERPQIGLNHTEITEERGWGGHCFPKDTSALLKTAESYNYDMEILNAAVKYNKKIRNGA